MPGFTVPVLIAKSSSTAAGTTQQIVVPAGGVPAGSHIEIATQGNASIAASVADTAGNVYVKDESAIRSGAATALFRCENSLALVSGNTITVTWPVSINDRIVIGCYSTGGTTASFDAHGNNQGLGAITVAATGATVQATEIVFACAASDKADAWTVAAGWTMLDTVVEGTRGFSLGLAYRILSATETPSAAFTGGSSNSAAALAAYKAATGGGTTYTKAGSIMASVLDSGADAFTSVEAGSFLPSSRSSGADSFNAVETGSVLSGSYLSAADAFSSSETGSLLAASLLAGTSLKISAGKTGSLMANALVSGADAETFTEAGSLLAKTLASGADAYMAQKSGSVFANGAIYGADVFIATETGSVLVIGNLSGLQGRDRVRAGSLLSGVILAGVKAILSGYQMQGNEIHLLTSAAVEKGKLTVARPDDAVLVVVTPDRATLTSAKVVT